MDSSQPPSQAAVQGMISWLSVRQQAVDDAKRAHPAVAVEVYHYTEVNLVADCMSGVASVCVAKSVLPWVSVDFVSYSSYDTTNFVLESDATANSAGSSKIWAALDYLNSKLQPRTLSTGNGQFWSRRVFVGEYGIPISAVNSPAAVARKAQLVSSLAMRWGCPFVLFWEYDGQVGSVQTSYALYLPCIHIS